MDEIRKDIDALWRKIAKLNDLLWEGKAFKPNVEAWLSNFENENEKQHALFLLSKFIYYGELFVRELTHAIYRDLYRYPLIKQIRLDNGGIMDETLIESEFKKIMDKTIILPMGGSSDSGGYLLYLFRQESDLPMILFDESKPADRMEKIILIDDFCGSGSQATNNSVMKRVEQLRVMYKNAKIFYYLMMGTDYGLDTIRSKKIFDDVRAVITLDSSFKCFSLNSRAFEKRTEYDKQESREICEKYGERLFNSNDALGFGKCQLLIGFHHNIPDNTLPIIWCEEGNIRWTPIFKRYVKKYE